MPHVRSFFVSVVPLVLLLCHVSGRWRTMFANSTSVYVSRYLARVSAVTCCEGGFIYRMFPFAKVVERAPPPLPQVMFGWGVCYQICVCFSVYSVVGVVLCVGA